MVIIVIVLRQLTLVVFPMIKKIHPLPISLQGADRWPFRFLRGQSSHINLFSLLKLCNENIVATLFVFQFVLKHVILTNKKNNQNSTIRVHLTMISPHFPSTALYMGKNDKRGNGNVHNYLNENSLHLSIWITNSREQSNSCL